MNTKQETEKYFFFMILAGSLILLANLYYYAHPLLSSIGLTNTIADSVFLKLHSGGAFSHSYKSKIIVLLLVCPCLLSRTGRLKTVPASTLVTVGGIGLILYFLPVWYTALYVMTTSVGAGMIFWTCRMLSRRTSHQQYDQMQETFLQCEELIETSSSVNLPTTYLFEGRMHHGWLNLISLERGLIVMGNPGSGKTYSAFEPCIETLIRKGNSMLLYDFKFPSLTINAYNQYLKYRHRYDVQPEFCIINFSDPRTSMRFNPFSPEFLKDPADASEVAEIVMQNVNKSAQKKEDFFTDSGRLYFDAATWFLRIYENGRYCTFPHVLELVSRDSKDVIKILNSYPQIRAKATPFANTLKGNASEQLTGMVTSAQIPIVKLADRTLYWILSGDDGSLDINDPKHPKILCLGNDPARQAINSSALALYTSRIFKNVNRPGKRPCAILLDELPTLYLKGLDLLMATARSNGVKTVLGMQDLSQLVRDYGDKEAEVIFSNVASIISGQVTGKTAERMSKMFGKTDIVKESETIGRSNDSINISRQKEELMPVSRIGTLSQGEFIGKVADTFEHPIRQKLFCARIFRDGEALEEEMKQWKKLPVMMDFGEDEAEQHVRSHQREYLLEYCKNQIHQGDVVYPADLLEEKAEEMLSQMTSEECDALLDMIIASERQSAYEKVLDDNMTRIQNEVDSIIAAELFRLNNITQSDDPRITDPFHGL